MWLGMLLSSTMLQSNRPNLSNCRSPLLSMHTTKVLTLQVAHADYASAIDWVLDKARCADRAYAVEAGNTHVAALAQTNARFREAMEQFDLIVPDGMPLVWALNSANDKDSRLSERVYGPTLMLKAFKSTDPTARHFLLGGKQSTLDKLQTHFSSTCPHAKIAGMYSPPFGDWPDDEFEKICGLIRESKANLIWVGLGCPKQEQWIAEHKDRLPPGVYFGIGAAFAFHAGEVKQAPELFQKNGMEWLFRLCMEPRRLWRRYFTYNSLFAYHYAKSRISSDPL